MHLKAQLPAAIAAALFAAGPILAGQLQPEPVPVPGATTAQSGVEMSGNQVDKQLILSSEAAKVNGTLEMTGYQVLLRSTISAASCAVATSTLRRPLNCTSRKSL